MKKTCQMLMGLFALAGVSYAEDNLPKINQGNFVGTSSFSFATESGKSLSPNRTLVDVSVGTEYFVFDRLSVGPKFLYSSVTGSNSHAQLGPGLTYFFWSNEQLAASVLAGYLFGLNSSTVQGRLFGGLALDYFLNPSISVGPYLMFSRIFDSTYTENYNRITFGGAFSLFL